MLTLAPCPAVTIVSGLLMLLLFLSELQYYLTTEVRGGLGVRGSGLARNRTFRRGWEGVSGGWGGEA